MCFALSYDSGIPLFIIDSLVDWIGQVLLLIPILSQKDVELKDFFWVSWNRYALRMQDMLRISARITFVSTKRLYKQWYSLSSHLPHLLLCSLSSSKMQHPHTWNTTFPSIAHVQTCRAVLSSNPFLLSLASFWPEQKPELSLEEVMVTGPFPTHA